MPVLGTNVQQNSADFQKNSQAMTSLVRLARELLPKGAASGLARNTKIEGNSWFETVSNSSPTPTHPFWNSPL